MGPERLRPFHCFFFFFISCFGIFWVIFAFALQIGNPLLDFDTDMNAVDEYYWSHGIITDRAYKIKTSLCNSSRVLREYFSGQISNDCVLAAREVEEEYSFTSFIDPYYVIGERCLSYNVSQAGFLKEMLSSGMFQFRKSHDVLQTQEPDQVRFLWKYTILIHSLFKCFHSLFLHLEVQHFYFQNSKWF